MKIKSILFLFIFAGIFSCTPEKRYVYLQDKNESKTDNGSVFTYRIRVSDALYIKIIPINDETSISIGNESNAGSSISDLGAYLNSYDVDDSGCVKLPLAGKIQVKDLTIKECQETIQESVNVYLKNATVFVKLVNFNITVLGEVTKPGTYAVRNNQVNILQALGMAGDLTVNGNRTDIMVVRSTENNKIVYLDLTDKNIISSPYFYLLPEDVVYVKPNKAKFFGTNPFPFATVISTITTLLLILNYFSK
ncbi:MAG: polysaccharide biosynthesis/export family protein [Bacteroidota bacterium]